MQSVSRLIDICYTMADQTTRSLYLLSDFFFFDTPSFTDWILPRPATDVSLLVVFLSKQLITMEPSFHSLRHFWNID